MIDTAFHLADLAFAMADNLLLDLLLGLLFLLHHEEDGFFHVGELLGFAFSENLRNDESGIEEIKLPPLSSSHYQFSP